MRKILLFVLLGLVLTWTNGRVLAFNSGAVEVGDLETGSIVGQPFSSLPVDLEFHAMQIGEETVWFPPAAMLNLKNQGTGGRAGRPVVFKVINKLGGSHNFSISADSAFAGPSSMNVDVDIPAGETKYIGITLSHFTYVTADALLEYECKVHTSHLKGQLHVFK